MKSKPITRLSHLTEEEYAEFYKQWESGESFRTIADRMSEKLGFRVSKNLPARYFPKGLEIHKHIPITEDDRKRYAEADERIKINYHKKRRIPTNRRIRPNARNKVAEVQNIQGQGKVYKQDIIEDTDVLFSPNKGPQTRFLAAPEDDVLFGGAAGGGKSVALIVDPLRYIDKSGHRVLIMRRTFRELRQLIDLSRQLYTQAFSGARYKEGDKIWTFPSGAKVEFGYLEKEGDVYQYQGNDYTYIAFDELTQLPTEFPWSYLFSRLRTPDPSIITYARASANPGGVGNDWVRKRYIEPSPPGESFTGPDGLTRRFIPSFLSDNPYLTRDGKYERMLQSLPPIERKRLLEGDWWAVEGSAFPEFRLDTHVVSPFDIPRSWKRFRAIDYGYSAPSCCLWMAISPEDGTVIVYRELYQKGLVAETLAEKILEMEMDDVPMNGVIDGAVFNRVGYNNTVGQIVNSFGLKLRSANKDRKAGKQQIHSRLAQRDGKRPGVQIFETCPNLIREMQGIPVSKKDPEDVDTTASDHAYDALRYGLMSVQPLPTRQELFYDTKREAYSSGYRPSDPFFGY